MSQDINRDRRRFLKSAAVSIAVADVVFGCAATPSTDVTRAATSSGRARTSATFAALEQIDAGLLNVGYAEAGPADGRPVLLLHGWPYDIHSFVDVAPVLASAGYRVIVPHLRGYDREDKRLRFHGLREAVNRCFVKRRSLT